MAENKYIEVFGALKSPKDVRDYKINAATAPKEFPEEFELEMCSVKSQGSVSSCVAHSLAEVVEYHNKKQMGTYKKMSTAFIYGNRKNTTYKGEGMYTREALASVCKYGDATNDVFPGNKEVPEAIKIFEEKYESIKDKALPNRFSTYFRCYSDNDIKTALMNYGPVVFAIDWYDDIKVDKNGIMQSERHPYDKSGGHCMVIYGWNKDGWKIQNSWGTTWGKGGRAILPFDFPKDEAWGVTDTIIEEDNTDIVRPFNTTFTMFIAKILNWLLNLFCCNED